MTKREDWEVRETSDGTGPEVWHGGRMVTQGEGWERHVLRHRQPGQRVRHTDEGGFISDLTGRIERRQADRQLSRSLGTPVRTPVRLPLARW